MVTMSILLTRLPQLSRSEFQAYWTDVHTPLILELAAVLGIRRYLQFHSVCDALTASIAASGGAPAPCDGLAQVWYDDLDALAERMKNSDARAAARRIRDDEEKFILREKSQVWWSSERAVF